MARSANLDFFAAEADLRAVLRPAMTEAQIEAAAERLLQWAAELQ